MASSKCLSVDISVNNALDRILSTIGCFACWTFTNFRDINGDTLKWQEKNDIEQSVEKQD